MGSIARLTDIHFQPIFRENPRTFTRRCHTEADRFNWKARKRLGFYTLRPMILAFIALLLGSWDLGSGELSGAGLQIGGFLVLKAVSCGVGRCS